MNNQIPFCVCESKAATCARTYRNYDGRCSTEMTLPICMHCHQPIISWTETKDPVGSKEKNHGA